MFLLAFDTSLGVCRGCQPHKFDELLIHSVARRMDGFTSVVCPNDLDTLDTVHFDQDASFVSIVSKCGMIKTDEH